MKNAKKMEKKLSKVINTRYFHQQQVKLTPQHLLVKKTNHWTYKIRVG